MKNQSISLAMYGINVRVKKSKKYCKLDKLPVKNNNYEFNDLFDILKLFFSQIYEEEYCLKSKYDKKNDSGNRIYLSEYDFIKEYGGRGIYGIVQFGSFGNERRLQDVTEIIDKSDESYINQNEAVFNPYYFLIVVPEDFDQGYLILEQKSGRGIKGIFYSVFLDNFNLYSDFSHYKIDLSAMVPSELSENFFDEGKVKSIKLIKKEVSEDVCDDVGTDISNIEVYLRTGKFGKLSPKQLLEKYNEGLISFKTWDYDKITVTSEFKGNEKIFDLNNPDSILPYLNITSEIDNWEKGNPELKSIHKVALNHLNNNFSDIYKKYA